MADGIEIFKRVTLARQPERAVEQLASKELASLITELEGKRWNKSYIAADLLNTAIDTAVGRFITEVNYLT